MSWRESTVCKSPIELKRQKMYKMSTPPWKETYRKKCKERLAESRRSLLQQLRMGGGKMVATSVEQVLTDEFKQLQTSNENLSQEENMDDLLEMLEGVRQELIREEQQELEKLAGEEKWMKIDEIDDWLNNSANQEFEESQNCILCPICFKNNLTICLNVLHCRCGLRIDTEQDALTLQMVKASLEESTMQHSSQCSHPPSFSVFQQLSLSNLLMSCKACDFLYIIV